MTAPTSAIVSNVEVAGAATLENVVITLAGPQGVPLTAQNFRIYSASNNTPVQVDPVTAAYLYKEATEINFLEQFYGTPSNNYDAAQIESSWDAELNSAEWTTGLSWLSTTVAQLPGAILGSVVSGDPVSPAVIDTFESNLADLGNQAAKISVAAVAINDAKLLLDKTYNSQFVDISYDIFANQAIDGDLISQAVNNTFVALSVGGVRALLQLVFRIPRGRATCALPHRRRLPLSSLPSFLCWTRLEAQS